MLEPRGMQQLPLVQIPRNTQLDAVLTGLLLYCCVIVGAQGAATLLLVADI